MQLAADAWLKTTGQRGLLSCHWFCQYNYSSWGFPGASDSKESACDARICLRCTRPGSDPWVRKIPRRRAWQPTPVFLPGEFHGQRSLADTVHGVTKSRTQPTLSLSMVISKDKIIVSSKSGILILFGTWDRFRGRRFVHRGGVEWERVDDSGDDVSDGE